MNWYVAPVCHHDPNSGYHPLPGDGSVCSGFIPGIVVHAYDPDPETLGTDGNPPVPTTCLVGHHKQGLQGWTPLTLLQAVSQFQARTGRAPLPSELF